MVTKYFAYYPLKVGQRIILDFGHDFLAYARLYMPVLRVGSAFAQYVQVDVVDGLKFVLSKFQAVSVIEVVHAALRGFC